MPREIEAILDDEAFLVSETDEKGIIKFANDDFCEYAGYNNKELIGMPHSMVRHRDMPKAAFEDLWNTVQKGETWRGFVKNLTKDGGYYWVYATVFSFRSSDGQNSYISCRKKASKKEILESTELYKTMK